MTTTTAPTALVDKLANVDVERALLGAVLIGGRVEFDRAGIVKPEDFKTIRHGVIWGCFTTLANAEKDIDVTTTSYELQRAEKLDEIGGDAYLSGLINSCENSTHTASYAATVADLAARRREYLNALDRAQRAANLTLPLAGENVQAVSGQPRYVIRSGSEALQLLPPRQWIVEGLISRGGLYCFYGEPGSKKSYAMLSLAACVASGQDWLDFKTHRARALFVDEDSGEFDLLTRAHDVIRGTKTEDVAGDLALVSLAGFMLDNRDDVRLLEREISQGEFGLVVFDALADIMAGDENSKEETQPVLKNLRWLAARTNVAVIVVHHPNKQGGYRGTSAIKGKVDALIKIELSNGSDLVEFTSEKVRNGRARKWAARASWGDGLFYLTPLNIPERKAVLSKSQQFVIDYLTENGARPLPVIMAAADVCSPGTARNAVYSLVPLKMVYRTNPNAPANAAAIYDLENTDHDTTPGECNEK